MIRSSLPAMLMVDHCKEAWTLDVPSQSYMKVGHIVESGTHSASIKSVIPPSVLGATRGVAQHPEVIGMQTRRRWAYPVIAILLMGPLPTSYAGTASIPAYSPDLAHVARSPNRTTLPSGLTSGSALAFYEKEFLAALKKAQLLKRDDTRLAVGAAAEAYLFMTRLGIYFAPTVMRISEDGCFTAHWRKLGDAGLLLVFSGDGEATYAIQSKARKYTDWRNFDVHGPIPSDVADAFYVVS